MAICPNVTHPDWKALVSKAWREWCVEKIC